MELSRCVDPRDCFLTSCSKKFQKVNFFYCFCQLSFTAAKNHIGLNKNKKNAEMTQRPIFGEENIYLSSPLKSLFSRKMSGNRNILDLNW